MVLNRPGQPGTCEPSDHTDGNRFAAGAFPRLPQPFHAVSAAVGRRGRSIRHTIPVGLVWIQPPRGLPVRGASPRRRPSLCRRPYQPQKIAPFGCSNSHHGSLRWAHKMPTRRGNRCGHWCWFSASCRTNASRIVRMNRCRQCSAFLWNGLPKPNSWENILAGNLWKGDASNQESELSSCLKNGPAPRCARRSGTDRPAILLTQCGSRRPCRDDGERRGRCAAWAGGEIGQGCSHQKRGGRRLRSPAAQVHWLGDAR
jgi:hypothetical protein